MKKLFLIMSAGFIQIANAQTVYYSNQNGMPTGSAQTVGNTTYYSNQNGMPVGTAQVSGNTVYYSNQNGMPMGTAQLPQASSPQPAIMPMAPLFPSSPIGR